MPGTPARRFGAFEALELLVGKGGQGRLFAARCLEDGVFEGLHAGDEVVLKAMPVRADDPEKAYRRLTRRTTALVEARHPGIVRYYGCFETEGGGIDDAMHVVVMELLHGETLEERLKREPLGLDGAEGLAIVRTCLEALVHAASFGIVHRDIKPSNVFLCEDGGVKLIDFEVARQATGAQTTTESGAMQGTFDYMAPDFHPNFRPDPKFRGDQCSDVFSLAVTLHEMLTGRRPYAAGPTLGDQSMMAFFQRWTKADGVDPRRAVRVDGVRIHALRHLQRALRKALQPNRAERFQTYAEFLAALENVEPRILEGGIDRYRLSKCVGKGGFGVVYKAFRESNGAAVAVKVLLRAEYAERFDREGRVLMKFDDDRIVPFVEAFAAGDPVSPTHFLVMGFLDGMPGSSLKDRLGAEPSHRGLPRSEVVPAFVRFAGGLQVLHDEGVYHRDIKPANLYCPAGEPERACLMDLGVVRTEETHTNGGLPGTLDYMAPELATGGSRGDALSDVYALGLCLYEALTGRTAYPRLPRGSEGVAAFYARAQAETPPDLSGLEDEPELLALLRSMTAVRRGERPASAARAAALLRAVPVRETATAAEADAAAVASGSEDSTDDLVFPVPAAPAATPPEPVPSGEPEAETAAAVPDGETQALPPTAAGEKETEAVPAAVEAGGETQTVPDERPAESASVAEGETQAVVPVAPPAEGETAAMPEAAAAEDGETQVSDVGETQAAGAETQATNVAETAATAALDASETLATRATEFTQTTRATESAPSVREKAERPRSQAGGVREIKPKSGTKSLFAAAAVLVLCVLATCAILFQKDIKRYFDPWRPEFPIEISPPSSTPGGPVVVEPENNPPVVPDKTVVGENPPEESPENPDVVDNPPADLPENPVEKEAKDRLDRFGTRISLFEENSAPSLLDDMRSLDETAKTLLAELEKANFEAETADIFRNRIEKKQSDLWNSFVSGRTVYFSNRISTIRPGPETSFEQAIDELSTIQAEIEKERDQVPESCRTGYKTLETTIDEKKTKHRAQKEHDDALAAAETFRDKVSNAKDQTARTALEASISSARKTATEKGTEWNDVVQACDSAAKILNEAIEAFETVDAAVKDAVAAKDFDDLVNAYAKLNEAKTTPGIPKDAEAKSSEAMTNVIARLEKESADFSEECGKDAEEEAYKANLETASDRIERLDKLNGDDIAFVREACQTALENLRKPVELTLENGIDDPVSVVDANGRTVAALAKKGDTKNVSVSRWTPLTARPSEHVDDYKETESTHSSGNGGIWVVNLTPKSDPVIQVSVPSSVLLAVWIDQEQEPGKPVEKGEKKEFSVKARTEHVIHWEIPDSEFPADYKTSRGEVTVQSGNRGTSKAVSIPSPEQKDLPKIVFSVSSPSAPALRATVGKETTTFSGGKTGSIFLDPRRLWTASFQWADENGTDWWEPVGNLEFETKDRGTVVEKTVTVRPSGEKIKERIVADNFAWLEMSEDVDNFVDRLSGFVASGFSDDDNASVKTAVSDLLAVVDGELGNDDNTQASDWEAALNGARLAFVLSRDLLHDANLTERSKEKATELFEIETIKNSTDNESVKTFKETFGFSD